LIYRFLIQHRYMINLLSSLIDYTLYSVQCVFVSDYILGLLDSFCSNASQILWGTRSNSNNKQIFLQGIYLLSIPYSYSYIRITLRLSDYFGLSIRFLIVNYVFILNNSTSLIRRMLSVSC
jgi:hypothetical protein